ncbi:unnamed protein product [Fraxinus pennsylvanica]|uniref:Disease resistance N-terminal domain-containing protein n=1 Tax=Fraxinus pennsylvanica TaxID=56036 RepID=A0AAD1YWL7_9LAMI|nr:unnamed protein product [Fraxinus pennsylvanica]
MEETSMEYLLQSLKNLVFYNDHLILDVKGQVKALYNNLDLLKALFTKAEKIQNKNGVLKQNQIRDVLYEAEDIVDKYVTESAAQKLESQNALNRRSHPMLRSLGKQIESISTKVKKIYEKNKGCVVQALQEGEGHARRTKEREIDGACRFGIGYGGDESGCGGNG